MTLVKKGEKQSGQEITPLGGEGGLMTMAEGSGLHETKGVQPPIDSPRGGRKGEALRGRSIAERGKETSFFGEQKRREPKRTLVERRQERDDQDKGLNYADLIPEGGSPDGAG